MNTEQIRRQEKILTTPGQVPTVPSVANHTLPGWLDTDIYIGEWCLNAADHKWYSRSNSGIIGPFTTAQDLSTAINSIQDSISALAITVADKANSSHTHSISDITNLPTTLDGKAAATHSHATSEVNGLEESLNNLNNALASKADLFEGKLIIEQLPKLAITEFYGEFDSEEAMLSMTVDIDNQPQRGDWVIRTDLSKVFVLIADNYSSIHSWRAIEYPASPVTSVNYQTGDVYLSKTSIGLGNVDNTSDVNKPVSTAQAAALAGKAASTHSHAISDITNLQTNLDGKELKASNAVVASTWTTTNNTLTDVTDLVLPLDANTTYRIEISLTMQCSTANGSRISVTFPSGATVNLNGFIGNTASATKPCTLNSTAESATFAAVADTDMAVLIIGRIKTAGSSGNLQLKARSVTSGNTTRVMAESYIRATKIA